MIPMNTEGVDAPPFQSELLQRCIERDHKAHLEKCADAPPCACLWQC